MLNDDILKNLGVTYVVLRGVDFRMCLAFLCFMLFWACVMSSPSLVQCTAVPRLWTVCLFFQAWSGTAPRVYAYACVFYGIGRFFRKLLTKDD